MAVVIVRGIAIITKIFLQNKQQKHYTNEIPIGLKSSKNILLTACIVINFLSARTSVKSTPQNFVQTQIVRRKIFNASEKQYYLFSMHKMNNCDTTIIHSKL